MWLASSSLLATSSSSLRASSASSSSLLRYASASSSAKKLTSPSAPSPAPPPKYSRKSPNLMHRILSASMRDADARQAAINKRLTPPDKTSHPDLTEEERQLAYVKTMLEYRKSMKRKGIAIPPIVLPLFDHAIPYAVRFGTRAEYPSWRAMWHQFWRNRVNDGKNAFAMRHIAFSNSFPGVSIDRRLGWFRSTYLFLRHIFGTQSLKASSWVAPMRQEMLEQYIQLNTALALKSERITALTVDPFRAECTALALQTPKHVRAVWSFHSEVSPTRILSLRATDGAFEKDLPVTGTRVGVQALVRFDTEQSVELYANDGTPLHTPAPLPSLPWSSPQSSSAPAPASPAPRRPATHRERVPIDRITRVPAERKRVIEYLVMDKPMYDVGVGGEWQFRARWVAEEGRTVVGV